jgi:hypothetical protein
MKTADRIAQYKADIFAFLVESGPAHRADIARAIGARSFLAVNAALAQMKSAGEIKLVGEHTFTISR